MDRLNIVATINLTYNRSVLCGFSVKSKIASGFHHPEAIFAFSYHLFYQDKGDSSTTLLSQTSVFSSLRPHYSLD